MKNCIEEDDTVSFQNACIISTDAFVDLLAYYLRETCVSFGNKRFLQKYGVCIGLNVAPIFADIFLLVCDH